MKITTDTIYATGKIYCVKSEHTDKIYIGSTTQSLKSRFTSHKMHHKLFGCGKLPTRVSAFELLDLGDCYIELIEDYPCESRTELEKRETHHIQLNKDIAVNEKMPWYDYKTADRERYKRERDQILSRVKEYYKKNSDKIKARARERIQCECGCTVRRASISKHRKTEKHQSLLKIKGSC